MILKRFFCTLLFCIPITLCAEINSNHDFQTWFFHSVNKPINKKATFYLDSEVRFGSDSSVLYLGYFQTICKYEVTPHFAIAPGYRQQWTKGSLAAPFRPTYNPFCDGIIKLEGKHLLLFDRSRLQYIIFERLKNAFLYRNRIYLTTVKDFGKMKAKPFVAEEVFFLERVGFQENRLNVGMAWPLDKLTPNIFYMIRHRRTILSDEWTYQNIFGLSLFSQF